MKGILLNISERLTISVSGLLPSKDNIDRLLIRKEVIKKVQITSEEAQEVNLKQEGDYIGFDQDKNTEKEISLNDSEINYVRECLKSMSDKKELTANMVDIYQKFIK